MEYTLEQCQIIYSEDSLIKVKAMAGTGKTTVLEAFTKERPMNTFLYLTYNKGIKQSSRTKFPSNTQVHTIASLAFKYIGEEYKYKLIDNLRISNVMDLLDIDYILSQAIIDCLNFFFNSNLKEIDHPDDTVKKLSSQIFNNMIDINNEEYKITFEGLTKYFELLQMDLKFDYVIIDEAQDINEVSKSIIDRQTSKKIYVGDNLQSIYGYRNTVSLLEDYTHTLSETFRFGENISNFVTTFIQDYINPDESILSRKEGSTFNEKSDKYTLITRTNAYLFDKAVELTNLNKSIHIIGEGIVFNELLDGMNLYKGDLYKIKSKYIRDFKSFANMKKTSEKIKDAELRFLVKIVEKYGENIEFFVKKIRNSLIKAKFADIILTTTHKSKGLEFFNVKIGEDFTPLFDKNGKLIKIIDNEELNIYYVAMTRVIDNLILNNDLNKKYGEIIC